jgi:protocatechuate 3,4-dioxygenase beta subunit
MKRAGLATAIAIVAAALLLFGAGPASAAGTGTVSGQVTDTSANPLAGICVSAVPQAGGAGGNSGTTDASGNYSLTVTAGAVNMTFGPCPGSSQNYVPQTIEGVPVTAGQTTTQDATLAPAGSISGKVTNGSGGPLAGVCVGADPSAPGGQSGSGQTDASGWYSISGLAPGSYTLSFSACTAGNYAPATITGVQVIADQTKAENATLASGGTITGKVTNSSGAALAGVCVSATSTSPNGGGGNANTGTGGVYTITRLGAGTYTLTLNPCSAGNYQSTAISGVQVSAGQPTTQNATLASAGTISGKVTDSSGKALAGVCVVASPSGGGTVADTNTSATGMYSLSQLAPGTYSLAFSACSAGNYVSQTIPAVQVTATQTTTENATLASAGTISGKVTDTSGKALAGVCVVAIASASGGHGGSATTDTNGLYTINGLSPGADDVEFDGCTAGNYVSQTIPAVQVTAGKTATENASLTLAATISGKVTDTSGKALAGICVSAAGAGPNGQNLGATTNSNGMYAITGLPANTYTVTFSACSGADYVSKTIANVQVTPGNTAIENASLATGGIISGKVTDSAGKPLVGACVGAILSGTDQGPGATTGSGGTYTIAGLPSGTYSVQFNGCSAGNYVGKTINGVKVAAAQTATESASLALGGTISGKVTDSSGKPLAGICVSAFLSGSQAGAGANTDSTGAYTFSGLAPGTYTVTFASCGVGNYATQTLPAVQVTAGKTTTQNAKLAPGGTISGKVTNSSAKPIAGACVSAVASGTSQGPGTSTDANGNYTLNGLGTGTYTVEFDACGAGNYAVQTITGVKVTAGKATTLNATLVPGGILTGKVSDSAGKPIAGACLTITVEGQTGTIKTDSTGTYTLTDVPPGTYTLSFSGCTAGNYVSKTIAGVSVASGKTTTENVSLASAGTITGKVTNSAGTALPGVCVSFTGPASHSTTTNSSGVYTAPGLPPGTYTLTFKGCTAGTYLTKTITGVAVSASKTTTENVVLVAPGTITGKVASSTGTKLSGACVSATGPQSASATTNSSGVYSLTGLAAGSYTLTITGCTAGNYVSETITGVAVTAGKTTTKNASLTAAGTIAGKVTNAAGTALAGACVSFAGPASHSTTTNSSGFYTKPGLLPGKYTLTLKGCTAGSYLTKTITGVAVAAGKTTTENATLASG